jgi:hypothetical protein
MTIYYFCPIRRAYITTTVPTEVGYRLMRWV